MSNIAITPNSSGTGTISITAPNTNTNRTIALPDVAGNVVTTGDSATVTDAMMHASLNLSAKTLTMPAGHTLQTVGLGFAVTAASRSLSVTYTAQIMDGFVKSIIPRNTNSDFIVSAGGLHITGSGAREYVHLYVRVSTTDTGVNFDETPNTEEQFSTATVTNTTSSTSGWTKLGVLGYSNLDNSQHNQMNYIRNSGVPSYTSGQTLQFGLALGADTSGYSATITFGGNTSTSSPYLFISEVQA